MRKKVLWVVAALVLVAIPAVIGLIALRGDDDGSTAARRAAALVAPGTGGGAELLMPNVKETGGNAIDVESWSWGVANPNSAQFGATRTAGSAKFNELNFTKKVDASSPGLFLACANGTHLPTATLTLRKAGAPQEVYLIVTMTDVVISSFQLGGGSSEMPTEQVSLNFAKIQIESKPTKGSTEAPTKSGWDITTQKAL